jgi:hypothetical protein
MAAVAVVVVVKAAVATVVAVAVVVKAAVVATSTDLSQNKKGPDRAFFNLDWEIFSLAHDL